MARHRKFAVSEQRKLIDQAIDIAVGVGAVPTPDGFHQFQLETTVGLLCLSFTGGHALVSIFGCFDEPERAVALIGRRYMNAHSGKWNRHVSGEDDPESFLLSFKADLERLLVSPI
jgi:hypothetical protein